jgi:hypothetical protein
MKNCQDLRRPLWRRRLCCVAAKVFASADSPLRHTAYRKGTNVGARYCEDMGGNTTLPVGPIRGNIVREPTIPLHCSAARQKQ